MIVERTYNLETGNDQRKFAAHLFRQGISSGDYIKRIALPNEPKDNSPHETNLYYVDGGIALITGNPESDAVQTFSDERDVESVKQTLESISGFQLKEWELAK
jgi:hypothetical protein